MRQLVALFLLALTGCEAADAAVARELPRAREFELGRARENAAMPYFGVPEVSCPAPSYSCDTGNQLLAATDFANAAWEKFGSGAAAPTVSALASTTIDGQTVSYNRIQFAAVAGGQESTVYANVSGGACKRITCTYSILLRSHSGAGTPSGNLPIGTAAAGGDGQNYQMCPFTSSWSRCELQMDSTNTAGFSYWWMGYVASQSGTSGALDLDVALPKAELGAGGATAVQCPMPLQDAGVLPHTDYLQQQVVADWGIQRRDGAGMFMAADGTLVLLGGWHSAAVASWDNKVTTNEVWKSTNDGQTWTAVLAHDSDPPQTGAGQRWNRRHSACWLQVGTALYVIGGDGFDTHYNSTGDGVPPYPTDVWKGSLTDYGATWTRQTATAAWGNVASLAADGGYNGRVLHSCWADDSGNLYVAGGQTSLLVSSVLRDVWKSADEGVTWTQLADAPWVGRGTISNALPRLAGKTLLAGGEAYDTNANDRLYYNDVWTFDDSTWRRVKESALWSARGYHSLLSLGSRFFLLKGYPNENSKGVYSVDSAGACWRKERATAGGSTHAASAAAAVDGGYIIITDGDSAATVTRIRAP